MTVQTQQEPATSRLDVEATDVGSVFVSNYPPYSFWSEGQVPAAIEALDSPPRAGVDLGLYLHIPFCRKRCKFCYFRVFTDKNSEQIERYLEALAHEVEVASQRPALRDRPLSFVYFGGGTPSYIAVKQLLPLVERLKAAMPWTQAREIAFECEPGTLTESKLRALREMGVTRLSLGIENFNDEILRENGRAHLAPEIYRVKPWIDELDFPQLNVDLIAGMVGESWETWRETVERCIDYDPDSVTIYQMELPFNTVYSKGVLKGQSEGQSQGQNGSESETAVPEFADWHTKREWHAYAIETMRAAGYELSSAYTLVKKDRDVSFVYRDSVWSGQDMIGCGVSSFSHVSGVHFQNADGWNDYLAGIESHDIAVRRAFVTDSRERLVRELILNLKTGSVDLAALSNKHGEDASELFSEPIAELERQELLSRDGDRILLSEPGLLRVDQLLPGFYQQKYQGARYT